MSIQQKSSYTLHATIIAENFGDAAHHQIK